MVRDTKVYYPGGYYYFMIPNLPLQSRIFWYDVGIITKYTLNQVWITFPDSFIFYKEKITWYNLQGNVEIFSQKCIKEMITLGEIKII